MKLVERDRRVAGAAGDDVRRRLHLLGIGLHREHQAADRVAARLALRGGEAVARHRVRRRAHLHVLRVAAVAVDAEHVAGLGRDDLAEGEGARRGIGEVLHPVAAARAARAVLHHFDGRLGGEARLAAGRVGLLRFPMLDVGLDRDGLDRVQALGAAHGLHRAADHGLLAGGGGAGNEEGRRQLDSATSACFMGFSRDGPTNLGEQKPAGNYSCRARTSGRRRGADALGLLQQLVPHALGVLAEDEVELGARSPTTGRGRSRSSARPGASRRSRRSSAPRWAWLSITESMVLARNARYRFFISSTEPEPGALSALHQRHQRAARERAAVEHRVAAPFWTARAPGTGCRASAAWGGSGSRRRGRRSAPAPRPAPSAGIPGRGTRDGR